MSSDAIQKLIDSVIELYGPVTFYGSDSTEEHGTCFKIGDVLATFSAHTQEGTLPSDMYDIQIESIPPGDYIYTSVVYLNNFLDLVAKMRGHASEWPTIDS